MSTILITGASSGIGARAATRLAAEGATVFGASRNVGAVPVAAGVQAVRLDLTHEESISSAVDEVVAAAGPVNVLINCAGYGEFGAVEETDLADARQQLEVNVVGAMSLVQHVLPAMRRAGHGRIVNVSSLAGEFAAPLGGWYHASKFALEGISDSLRGEVAQFGIDVTIVQPSYVATEWHEAAMARLAQTSGGGPYGSMVDSMRRYSRALPSRGRCRRSTRWPRRSPTPPPRLAPRRAIGWERAPSSRSHWPHCCPTARSTA